MIDLITNNIKEAIPDSHVVVLNPMNDGVHFQAHVAAESFGGSTSCEAAQTGNELIKRRV